MYEAERRLAYSIARRYGLSRDNSDDIAGECVLRLLTATVDDSMRFVNRVAQNLSLNLKSRGYLGDRSLEHEVGHAVEIVGVTLRREDWDDTELAILRLMAAGFNDREIIGRLDIGEKRGRKVVSAVRAKGRELIEIC